MRIALAQVDLVVGDVDANLATVTRRLDEARGAGAELVVFPELTLTGYPLLDLVYRPDLLDRQRLAVDEVAARARGLTAIVGFIDREPERVGLDGRPAIYNAAAVVRDGALVATHRKNLLPDYDVFFERRYFAPGTEVTVVDVGGAKVGVEVCEDLWDTHYPGKVTRRLADAGADVIVNLSASPFHVGKGRLRRELIRSHIRACGRPVLFVNQVGAEDGYEGELVFDGESLAYDSLGRLIGLGRQFEEDLVLVDVEARGGRGTEVADVLADPDDEALAALVRAVHDFARRCGFARALVGLSGGIDSALVAVVAARALGASNVTGVAMPSRYSSEHSVADARLLAENLGIEFRVIPIDKVFQGFLDVLAPHFQGLPQDVTEENLQSRARGAILMGLSNKTGAMLLSTGNKTEMALGYCTLYGDMCGALTVLSDVSKLRVYSLARAINRRAGRELIPRGTLEKAPSAELRPGQVDPFDYALVSPAADLLIEEDLSVDACVARGYPRALVEDLARMVKRAEFKRRQAAPGVKITPRAFGPGRRIPL